MTILLRAVIVSVVLCASGEAATVGGRVLDSTGASLPGVTVEATGERGSRIAVTAADGSYRFDLEPGPWTLTFQLINFASPRRPVVVGSPPLPAPR
ncbi:MAG TPA: carboxypeptidase-like regulatory domain-containing protein [Thermoanaerobaculia bacterium]|nr:carboxypeptidase-like regulatory domain-containing protein [Thermoanaerobaculia bacterium]